MHHRRPRSGRACAAFLLAVLILMMMVLAERAAAIEFKLDTVGLGTYNPREMEQYPEWRVGIFARGSPAAKFAPGRERLPYVDIDVVISNPPHNFAEAFIYRWEAVKDHAGWQPCNVQGQSRGADLPFGVSQENARRIVGRQFSIFNSSSPSSPATISSGQPPIRINGRVNITMTGLWIVYFDACRFEGSTQLDVAGWYTAKMNGKVTVVNPYGGIPGQAYGYLPIFIMCVVAVQVAIAVLWIAYFWANPRNMREWYLRRASSLPLYQVATTVVIGIATVAYYITIFYFARLNMTDNRNYGLYTFAHVVLAVRNAVLRTGAFLFAIGHRITNKNTRYLTIAIVAGVCYAFIATMGIVAGQIAGVASPSHAQVLAGHPEPVAATSVIAIITAIFEAAIVLSLAAAMRRTFGVLRANIGHGGSSASRAAQRLDFRRQRLLLIYGRFRILVALTVLLGGTWWCLDVSGLIGFMRKDEQNWKLWWLADIGYELVTVVSLCAFVGITIPHADNLAALAPGTVVDLDEFSEIPLPPPVSSRPQRRRDGDSAAVVDDGPEGQRQTEERDLDGAVALTVGGGDGDDEVPTTASPTKAPLFASGARGMRRQRHAATYGGEDDGTSGSPAAAEAYEMDERPVE